MSVPVVWSAPLHQLHEQLAVKVEGGEEVADVVAAKFNLINRGQVRGEEEEGETSRGYKLASGEGLVVFTAAASTVEISCL